jgi:hypothetical protein
VACLSASRVGVLLPVRPESPFSSSARLVSALRGSVAMVALL